MATSTSPETWQDWKKECTIEKCRREKSVSELASFARVRLYKHLSTYDKSTAEQYCNEEIADSRYAWLLLEESLSASPTKGNNKGKAYKDVLFMQAQDVEGVESWLSNRIKWELCRCILKMVGFRVREVEDPQTGKLSRKIYRDVALYKEEVNYDGTSQEEADNCYEGDRQDGINRDDDVDCHKDVDRRADIDASNDKIVNDDQDTPKEVKVRSSSLVFWEVVDEYAVADITKPMALKLWSEIPTNRERALISCILHNIDVKVILESGLFELKKSQIYALRDKFFNSIRLCDWGNEATNPRHKVMMTRYLLPEMTKVSDAWLARPENEAVRTLIFTER